MPEVSHLLDRDKPEPRRRPHRWLKISAETYDRLLDAGGGTPWKGQAIGQNCLEAGLDLIEGRVEMIHTFARVAAYPWHRDKGGRLIDYVMSGPELEALDDRTPAA